MRSPHLSTLFCILQQNPSHLNITCTTTSTPRTFLRVLSCSTRLQTILQLSLAPASLNTALFPPLPFPFHALSLSYPPSILCFHTTLLALPPTPFPPVAFFCGVGTLLPSFSVASRTFPVHPYIPHCPKEPCLGMRHQGVIMVPQLCESYQHVGQFPRSQLHVRHC